MSDAERPRAVNPRAELVDVYKLWWAHDAHWYQGVAKRFGQEVANEINAEAMRQVAVQAGRRVAQQLGKVPDGGDAEELRRRLVACADRMFPPELRNASLDVADDDLIVLTVRRNFALAMLRMATSMESYQCPCTAIHAGWFEGLGVPLTENRTAQCQRHGDAVCESLMRFSTPDAAPAGPVPAEAVPGDTVPSPSRR